MTFPRLELSLTNISCKRLDGDKTRRFKTRIAVSDGAGHFTYQWSPVEELGRDCLAGMSDEDWNAEGDFVDSGDVSAEARRRKRWRKPPRGAVVKNARIRCRDLKDDPKAWKRVDCPGVAGQVAGDGEDDPDIVYGNCGYSYVNLKSVGGGWAIVGRGWRSFLGPITSGESYANWWNYDRGTNGRDRVGWAWGDNGGSRYLDFHTGVGLVGALHGGDVNVRGYGLCLFLDPYKERTITP